jgi:hypothetical protein
MTTIFDLTIDDDGILLRPRHEAPSLLGRLLGTRAKPSLRDLTDTERALAYAVADAEAVAEEFGAPEAVRVENDALRLSHDVAARLPSEAAAALGLPPLVHLTLETESDGVLGSPGFRLRTRWSKGGRRVDAPREGAMLRTPDGLRRLPAPMLEACRIADEFKGAGALEDHWTALARFRIALGEAVEDPGTENYLRMAEFLSNLRIVAADALSISPKTGPDGIDFDPVPFSRRRLSQNGEDTPSEMHGELSGVDLAEFQMSLRTRGARPAYKLGPNAYLAIDPSAAPALDVMARKQRAPRAEREAFVRAPRGAIAEAIEARHRASGALDGLSDAAAEAAVEALSEPVLVETREYSERVIGVERWVAPELPIAPEAPTTWLPEIFDDETKAHLKEMDAPALEALRAHVATAIDAGAETVAAGPTTLPATVDTLATLDAMIMRRRESGESAGPEPEEGEDTAADGPIVLMTADNYEEVAWRPSRPPRVTAEPLAMPPEVVTPLMPHQAGSLDWAVAAWKVGMPGILNADEQGLGKTLETIAFLAWARRAMKRDADANGPILVVAPTSLLDNWAAEVERHMSDTGLGHLLPLYGSKLASRKREGARGKETDDGVARLDFEALEEKIAKGRGHEHWILTTYTTLTNHQHSLGRIKFSVAVFDEVQAIKNPASLRAEAMRAVDADFRIGLTGTPVENRATDIWAIMDQLCPGALGSLREFTQTYRADDEAAMRRLHAAVFSAQDGRPALGMRRMKSAVASHLPPKERFLHPHAMPAVQADCYDEARGALTKGGKGGALKALQHIRSVSVHPNLDAPTDDEAFVAASARLHATMGILKDIAARGERALVFIETIRMQHRFAAIVRAAFGLERVDIINGATPVEKRIGIVNRFQRHLEVDGGFDLLILGPRAAGTGLTLTAATHVIHLSRWWNPAVEEQCNDRTHRIGQRRPVSIHIPLALHPRWGVDSFDGLLQALMERKRRLAEQVLWPACDTPEDAAALQAGLARDVAAEQSIARFDDAALSASIVGSQRFHAPERVASGIHLLRSRLSGGGAVLVATEDAHDPIAALQRARREAGGRIEGVFALSSRQIIGKGSEMPVSVLSGSLLAAWPTLSIVES